MRYSLFAVLIGFAVCAAYPAAAQNNNTYTNWQQQQQPVYVPMYVSPNGQQAYNGQGGGVPMYNAGAQPLPVEQLVAGKNAPSYNFNNNAYTGFGNANAVGDYGAMSPQQSAMLSAQRDAQVAATQQDYLAQLMQSGTNTGAAAPTNSSAYQGNAFSNLYQSNQQGQPQKPVKRRVVYRERNNPLTTPPRLFSID